MNKRAFMTNLSHEEITGRFHICSIQKREKDKKHTFKRNNFNGEIIDGHFSYSMHEGIFHGTDRYHIKGVLHQSDEGFIVTWAIKRNKLHLLLLFLILAFVMVIAMQTAFTDKSDIGLVSATIAIIPFVILLSRGKKERQALKEKLGEIFLCNVEDPAIQTILLVEKSPVKVFLAKRKVPVLIAVGIAVVLFTLNVETILNIPLVAYIKIQIADAEGLDVKPVPKEIAVIPKTDTRYRTSNDDLSFISPWGQEKDLTTMPDVNSYTFEFEKEKYVTIIKYDAFDYMKDTNVQKISTQYNEKIETYYDLQKLTLMVTPGDLKITKSMDEIANLSRLLVLKSIIPPSDKIYNFENSEIEGFVFARKYDSNEAYWVELHHLNDRYGYNFIFKNATEEEVFLILGSLKFADR